MTTAVAKTPQIARVQEPASLKKETKTVTPQTTVPQANVPPGKEVKDQGLTIQELISPKIQNIGRLGVVLKPNHPLEETLKGPEHLKNYHSSGQRALAYLKTDGGLFRFGQGMDRIPRFVNAVYEQAGMKPSSALQALSLKGLTGWTWLATFPRLITMTPGVMDAVKDARKAAKDETLSSDQRRYKYEYAFRETTDLAAMLGYGASMAIGLFPQGAVAERAIRTVADSFTLVHDTTSFEMNTRNLQAIRQIDLSNATTEMQQTVAETRKQNMLAIAKDVVSIVSGVLGLTLVLTGVSIVSGIILITISLASTILAVIRDLYKDTMMFKPIEFFNNKHVTQLTA